MPGYSSPGVYIEETRVVQGPIAPFAASATAFVGATFKGPLNTAVQVNNLAEYRESFGKTAVESPVSIAVLLYFSNGGRSAVVVRTAGPASPPEFAQIVGDAAKGTGVHALGKSPPASVLLTPDLSAMGVREHAAVAKSVIAYCEGQRIFYILDVPQGRSKQGPVEYVINWSARSGPLQHPNVALYFPRVAMTDPSRRSSSILASASGAIAGLYARTDFQQGIWQAPAGTKATLLGIGRAEMDLSEAEMGRLHGAGINALRPFPGCGIVAWGARTFTSNGADSEWRYVPVRRFFMFLERSIDRGLEWAVFEPNGEPLWAQVRLSISSFLNQLFRRGAFAGASAREAYFVKCGRDTMTPNDIRAGRIVVLVGFAPLKPAEFVVLRAELRAAQSS